MQIIKKTKTEDDRNIWNSELIEQAKDAIENGYDLIQTPFHENDINYRKGNLLFELTDYERNEIKKCAKDVIYFANNYAFTMTDYGMQQIVLRDYQKDVLKVYQEEKEVVFMASRQVGKCVFYNTKCIIKCTDGTIKNIRIGDLYIKNNKKLGILGKIKQFLYYILYKIK